jgi:REP element-mobilizing transposase RayT
MPYDDLRKGRYSETGQLYTITAVTHQREPLFHNLYCARTVITEMHRLQDEGMVDSLAWVVMPDHLHWLFALQQQATLGSVVHRFKGRSSHAINQKFKRSEAVWQRAYYDHALRREEDVQGVARYIVANPLRAGLVKRIDDYPHWDAVWL